MEPVFLRPISSIQESEGLIKLINAENAEPRAALGLRFAPPVRPAPVVARDKTEMNKPLQKIIYLIIALATTYAGCVDYKTRYHPGGPYYYKSYAAFAFPYKPKEEISYEEAKDREANGLRFTEVLFDKEGRLINVKHHWKGTVTFNYSYRYEPGVVKEINYYDDKITITMYDDKKGNRLSEESYPRSPNEEKPT